MKISSLLLIIMTIGCNSKGITGKYKSYWYETYHELVLKNNKTYKYKSEGHLGMGVFTGEYEIFEDTLTLKGEIVETGISKFLIVQDGCLVELETRFDYCKRKGDRWETSKRSINYPQLKEKSIQEKEDVIKMLEVAFTNPEIREYFKDTTESLIVQEYYEISKSSKLELTCFNQPVVLKPKREIESEEIEKYLIIDEINVGLNRAMIDFQIMPEFSAGILDFFYRENGNWILRKRRLQPTQRRAAMPPSD